LYIVVLLAFMHTEKKDTVLRANHYGKFLSSTIPADVNHTLFAQRMANGWLWGSDIL
jgi:hypothetical protein